jgi:hypothetical protein
MILEIAPRLDLPHLPLPKRPQLQLMLLRDVMRLHLIRRHLLMLQLRAHGVLLELRLLRRVHVRHPAGLAVPGHAVRRLLVHHLRLAVAVAVAVPAVPAVVRVLHALLSSSGRSFLSYECGVFVRVDDRVNDDCGVGRGAEGAEGMSESPESRV